ncbi:hypothetical protein AB6G14_05230 [Providencia hangzhouensis]|uniref:DUF4123 domain-containing protein n=1 Tax=Providencia hangzhouensis TaxID=3031799 RepID=UPI0034DD4167
MACEVKTECVCPIGELLDRKVLSHTHGGWAYRSSLDWQYQLRHWQNRQLVELNEELVVLRLMDTRIANVLIPKMREVDWSVLMTPVHEVMLETPSDPAFFN